MWQIMLVVASLAGAASAISCEEARMKCAYRAGCGMALQNYLVGCSSVLQGPYSKHCPEICQHSLIALTSTVEGQALMNCECSDQYCEDQKQRPEVCRPQVVASMNAPVVSCRVAQWICSADSECSTALEYYNIHCKAMFHGKKCSLRCANSINILKRQKKADKLQSCYCDGKEDYDCQTIQKNMNRLCFHKHSRHHNKTHHVVIENEVPTVVVASGAVKLFSSVAVLFLLTVSVVL